MRTLKRRPDSLSTHLAHATRRTHGPVYANYTIPAPTGSHLPPHTITAAAEPVYGKNIPKTKKRPPIAPWQIDSWELRKEIPEFRFSGDRVARGCSQYKLFIAKRPDTADGQPEKATTGPAFELSQRMFGNIAATQTAVHSAGQHLTFNGESLFMHSDNTDGTISWQPCSVRELTGQGTNWKHNNGIESRTLNPQTERVTRCWKPDPEFSSLADCAAQAVLPIARTLKGLGKRTAAEIDSRLAGAGVLLFPDDATVLAGQGQTNVVDALVESMLIPIQDPESAAALVPLMLQMRADSIDKVKHLSFATPLDEKLPEMETNAIRRVALGMDSPPETLLGLGTSNHWSGWLISSEEVQLVLSPAVATMCHAITAGIVTDMLTAMGEPNPEQYMVWFDASELELRPDKSTDSRDLFERGALSEAAMLRENGFTDGDAPTDEEKKTNLLIKLVTGAPSLAPLILPMLGIEVDQAILNKTADIADATDGAAPTGGDAETPQAPTTGQQTPPDRPTEQPDDNTETGPGQ